MNAETVPALAGQVELTVMQHASMAQVCLDLHDALGVRWGDNPYKRIDDLKRDSADLERERMRLAACGVVALANTPESAAKARDMHDDYRSASCSDVARMVDLQMQYRAALVNLRAGLVDAKNTNVVDYIDAVLGAA